MTLHKRIDAADLPITEDSVIVLQNAGPIGWARDA